MPLFRTQSAAEKTSLAPHDSKARLRPVTNRRDSWRSHVHRTHTAQRVQSFKIKTANVRGQGAEPLAFSWGFKGAILSRERMAPFIRTPCAAAGNPLRTLRCDNMNHRRVRLVPRPAKARIILHRHVGALAVVRDHGAQDVCLFVHADPAVTVARQREPLRACDLRGARAGLRHLGVRHHPKPLLPLSSGGELILLHCDRQQKEGVTDG